MIYVLLVISNLIFLLIGWYLGVKSAGEIKLSEGEGPEQSIIKVKDLFKPKSDLTPGVIRRPSAQAVNAKKEEPVKKATNQAMVETLKKIPEIEKMRQEVQSQKRG